MNCEIEPAINVYSREEYIDRIVAVREFAKTVQFDVIDGVFARPGNFNDPEIVKNNLAPRQIDLHLMVMDIGKEIDRWLKINPARITLHVEHPGDIGGYYKILESNNVKKGLAIAPFTPIEKIVPMVKKIDFLLVMSVVPGGNGQQFIKETVSKIRAIRARYDSVKIGVDGGVRAEHLSDLKDAGADEIVVGSSLFSGSVDGNYQKFNNILNA